jgi:hypothetical protein
MIVTEAVRYVEALPGGNALDFAIGPNRPQLIWATVARILLKWRVVRLVAAWNIQAQAAILINNRSVSKEPTLTESTIALGLLNNGVSRLAGVGNVKAFPGFSRDDQGLTACLCHQTEACKKGHDKS